MEHTKRRIIGISFRVIFIMLLLWIGYSINEVNKRIDYMSANLDAIYNELSTEMGSISEEFDYWKIDNLLVIDLLESINNKQTTKENNE
tara:strand:+ start:314 stop:580 length:267 start_codon:yes stop_codon:yes gene_type:complete